MADQRTAWGWGLASIDAAGTTLDVWYPKLTIGPAPSEADRPAHGFDALVRNEADARGVRRVPVFTVSDLDAAPADAADAYLRLHLLSMRLAKPNTINLDGIFGVLTNVVWTNYGPFAIEDFALRKMDVQAAAANAVNGAPSANVEVMLVDKMLFGNPITVSVAAVICLTLVVTVFAAKVVGCTLPLLAKKIGFDPAVMASPFITTVVDAISLMIYFNFASLLLGI